MSNYKPTLTKGRDSNQPRSLAKQNRAARRCPSSLNFDSPIGERQNDRKDRTRVMKHRGRKTSKDRVRGVRRDGSPERRCRNRSQLPSGTGGEDHGGLRGP